MIPRGFAGWWEVFVWSSLLLFFPLELAKASETCEFPTYLALNEPLIGGTAAVVNNTLLPGCALYLVEDLPATWFSIPGNGNIFTATTCDENTQVFTVLTVLELLEGEDCSGLGLDCAFSQEESTRGCQSSNLASQASWKTTKGVDYRILVSTEALGATFGILVTEQEPPTNDDCTGAIDIDIAIAISISDSASSSTFTSTSNSLTIGSTEWASPDISTSSTEEDCASFSFSNGVWYIVEATVPESYLTATTCTNLTTFDTALSIFSGPDDDNYNCTRLTCVANNDDHGGTCGETSSITWPAVLGERYYILVQGFAASSNGEFGLQVSETPRLPMPPRNDACPNAIGPLIPGPIVIEGDTFGSSQTDSPVTDACSSSLDFAHHPGIWYYLQGTGRTMRASTCTDFTQDTDTQLSVLVGVDGDGDCGTLQCIGGSDNDDEDGCGQASTLSWQTLALHRYYVVVHTHPNSTTTHFGLILEDVLSPYNDECQDATLLTLNDQSVIGTNLEATLQPDVCLETTTLGVWYSIVGTGQRLLTSTCSNRTDFDSRISVFSPEGEEEDCVAEDFICVSKSVPDVGIVCDYPNAHIASWIGVVDQVYYLLVHGADNATGTFRLTVEPFVLPTSGPLPTTAAPTALPTTSHPSKIPIRRPTASPTTSLPTSVPLGSPVTNPSTHSPSETPTAAPAEIPITNAPVTLSAPATSSPTQTPTARPTRLPTRDPTPSPTTSHPTKSPTRDPTTNHPSSSLSKSLVDGNVPINDSFEDAVPISTDGTLVLGSTVSATDDTEDLGLALCGTEIAAPGVWYLVEGAGTGVHVSTCDDATDYDTAVSVFFLQDNSLSCLGGGDNDQRCEGHPKSSMVAFFGDVGVSYYVLVHGTNAEVGLFGLTATSFDRVENDVCESAVSLEADGSLSQGSTWMATIDSAQNAFHCGSFVGMTSGVWYEVVGTGASLTATTCTSETNFNTALSIFQGDCGSFTTLLCTGGNDDDYSCAGQFGTSTFTWQTKPGEIYYILVHGGHFADLEDIFLSAYGDFGLIVAVNE